METLKALSALIALSTPHEIEPGTTTTYEVPFIGFEIGIGKDNTARLVLDEDSLLVLNEMIDAEERKLPAFLQPQTPKERQVVLVKTFRQRLDAVLQDMKEYRSDLVDPNSWTGPKSDYEDAGETIAQHTLAIRELESAIMRCGMTLKNIGNPNPYPDSYDPTSTKVEPTADNLKL